MKSNKVALITGSARRIGAQIARVLHAHDYNVVIHYRHSGDEANALVKSFTEKRPNSAIAVAADLNNIEELQNLIDETVRKFGQIDLLVNNASSFYATPIASSDERQWDELMSSNVKGAYFLACKAAPYLQKSHGHIVNIIDIYSQKPLKQYPIYSMAKAALLMMTKSLALELAPEVRVNGVCPGSTLWPEGDNAIDEQKKQELIAKTVLKKQADAKDIANAVLFFAESNTITGQIISIDSGRSIKM